MDERAVALDQLRRKKVEHREMQARLKVKRESVRELEAQFKKTEDDIKALQSVGQIIGEVLKQLDDDRFIVKASNGPRWVVGCRPKVDKATLKPSTRVALDITTMTIMRALPREVDPTVFQMLSEDPGSVTFSSIGGLNEQIRELREVVELPLLHPEMFVKLGIDPPKGVLLYGPPGTGKTLLARAVAHHTDCTFIRVSGSELVQKYIGEGSRMVRELFVMAREAAPSIIFMDEIDSIGSSRVEGSRGGDSEVQRTMLELLNQLDGFDSDTRIKVIAATNRPDTLDPALLRSGRLDRKIELPLPSEAARARIMQIHSRKMNVNKDDVNFDELARCTDDFNGAMLKAVCVEAGMLALRRGGGDIRHEDFMEGVSQVQMKKKSSLNYYA
mmetsp:Transcript_6682/g.18470  ORF Transcript_6682/g.18470 Transcript_6682/m.18470 type:complete len:387 (-) Transcript_6682:53-1213(-)